MAYNKKEEKSMFGEIEEIEDIVEKRFKWFKNFDTKLYPPFDHRFIDYKSKYIDPKKIMNEWEVLKSCLPSSIFVRAYEGRIDLMRAAITGLEGTPYCHGLFFFDILFPNSYPARPPEIFFHSYDFDSNPSHLNSYDKKVSSNLLNLNCWWYKWSPKHPDILQALVTIQQQVLNDKLCSDDSFMLKQSKKSNRETFMENCEAMLHTLQCPPKHFEDLVKGHFRKRAHPILLIYKNQMKADNDKSMNQFFFKLLKAFEANGAYCGHHYNKEVKEEESSGPPEEKDRNTGFFNKLKNILEL